MTRPRFRYVPSGRTLADPPEHSPVVIAGGGMVGLTLAIDLALRGVPFVVLEQGEKLSDGSRAICHAKRTLEIWDRLGVGEAIRDRGVTWRVGRVFHRDAELYSFDLQPEPGDRMPAFVNLQQYHVEAILHARLAELGGVVRHRHGLSEVEPTADGVIVTVSTPDGPYRLLADWLVAAEGVRSPTRRALGLNFDGVVFEDAFLIADVRMRVDFPAERWFWFDPPFHEGQTALLHAQADNVWRIDLQLDAAADPRAEGTPERVQPRIARMLGHDDFSFEWLSVYRFQCRTLKRYVHGRVLFAGDAAHQVSPFGARGGNGGVQDADNLGWKLAAVAHGRASASLLESYQIERYQAALENIGHSTRATDFMTPKSRASRKLRDITLALARDDPFARALVNSGRLSTACTYESPLSTPDVDLWSATAPAPGAPPADAPLKAGHLSQHLGRDGAPTLLAAGSALTFSGNTTVVELAASDAACARWDLTPDAAALLRPDGHVAARWRKPTSAAVVAALARLHG